MSANASPSCPSVLLRDAARGMAQQMVLWGHDVRHAGGNALVRFGLERIASSGLTGTSCYRMAWQGGLIELHGAVASWTAPTERCGCVFCRDRGRIELWNHDAPPVPGREKGSAGTASERWQAFLPFLEWLHDYETWAFTTLGEAWRLNAWRALKRLPKGKPWLPPLPALHWWGLALEGRAGRPKSLILSN